MTNEQLRNEVLSLQHAMSGKFGNRQYTPEETVEEFKEWYSKEAIEKFLEIEDNNNN